MYFAQLKGMSAREAAAELKKWFIRFGIESWWNKKVEELSKGMAQKVQFITTVVHKPSLLILDEPFSALSFKIMVDQGMGKLAFLPVYSELPMRVFLRLYVTIPKKQA